MYPQQCRFAGWFIGEMPHQGCYCFTLSLGIWTQVEVSAFELITEFIGLP